MARDAAPNDQQAQHPAEFDAKAWLEAHGLLHDSGDGCDHCDNWSARHWSAGQFVECADARCTCVLRV